MLLESFPWPENQPARTLCSRRSLHENTTQPAMAVPKPKTGYRGKRIINKPPKPMGNCPLQTERGQLCPREMFMSLQQVTKLLAVSDDIQPILARIVRTRGALAGDPLDERADVIHEIRLMPPEGPLYRGAAIELSYAAFRNVVAEQTQEIIADGRDVALDPVDGIAQQVSDLQLASRNE